MKKIIAAVAAALVFAGSLFAVNFTVDGSYTLPMNSWTSTSSSTYTNYKEKHFEFGMGFDVGADVMLNNQIGLRVAMGMAFPMTDQWSWSGKVGSFSSGSEVTTTYSDSYNFYNCFNLFFGTTVNVYNKKAFNIFVTPGILMQAYNASSGSGDSKTTYNWQNWGFGIDLEARYKVDKNIYLRLGCPLAYMFSNQDLSGKSISVTKFSFAPHFGVGYKF